MVGSCWLSLSLEVVVCALESERKTNEKSECYLYLRAGIELSVADSAAGGSFVILAFKFRRYLNRGPRPQFTRGETMKDDTHKRMCRSEAVWRGAR